MENAFSWLGNLVEWVGQLIPRIILIRATHGGVKFVRGHKVVVLKPGLHWYWPITTECVEFPVVRQTKSIHSNLTTKDNKPIIVTIVVTYSIVNIEKALVKSWDVDDTIDDISGTAIVPFIISRTFEEIRQDIAVKIKDELTKATKEELKLYGVKVEKCSIKDFSPCLVVRRIENTPHDPEE